MLLSSHPSRHMDRHVASQRQTCDPTLLHGSANTAADTHRRCARHNPTRHAFRSSVCRCKVVHAETRQQIERGPRAIDQTKTRPVCHRPAVPWSLPPVLRPRLTVRTHPRARVLGLDVWRRARFRYGLAQTMLAERARRHEKGCVLAWVHPSRRLPTRRTHPPTHPYTPEQKNGNKM